MERDFLGEIKSKLEKAFCEEGLEKKDLLLSELIMELSNTKQGLGDFNARITVTDKGVGIEGCAGVRGLSELSQTIFGIGDGTSILINNILDGLEKGGIPKNEVEKLKSKLITCVFCGALDKTAREEDVDIIESIALKYVGDDDE